MTLLAHGLGGSNDLPIPYTYALIGAAWVLTLTFAVVILAWRAPRFDPEHPGRPLPARLGTAVDSAATRWVLAIAGLLFWLWVGAADAGIFLAGWFAVRHRRARVHERRAASVEA